MKKIKIKGAFIEMTENKNYIKSEMLFLDTNIDYREVKFIDLKGIFSK